jgi:hypothetical protein
MVRMRVRALKRMLGSTDPEAVLLLGRELVVGRSVAPVVKFLERDSGG